MKTISADKIYVDYTSDETGVRVWEGRFQQLYRKTPDSDWETLGHRYPIPVSEEQVSWQFGDSAEGAALSRVSQIAFAIGHYEQEQQDPELGKLLRGLMSFSEATQ
jgi:hypothetical protein